MFKPVRFFQLQKVKKKNVAKYLNFFWICAQDGNIYCHWHFVSVWVSMALKI